MTKGKGKKSESTREGKKKTKEAQRKNLKLTVREREKGGGVNGRNKSAGVARIYCVMGVEEKM